MIPAVELRKRAKAITKPATPVEELSLYKECKETLEKYRSGTNLHWACIRGIDTQMWSEVRIDAKDKHVAAFDVQRVRNAIGKNGYYTEVYTNKYGSYLRICWDARVVATAAGLVFDPLTGELEKPCCGCPSRGSCDEICNKGWLYQALKTEERED